MWSMLLIAFTLCLLQVAFAVDGIPELFAKDSVGQHGLMDLIVNSKSRATPKIHPNNEIIPQGAAIGWGYVKAYFASTSAQKTTCDEASTAVEAGIATNLCVAIEVQGYMLSTIITCSSSLATGVFYNSTNCDQTKQIYKMSLPLNQCFPIPSNALMVENVNSTKLFCTASSTIPAPTTQYDWTYNLDFRSGDTQCQQPVTYSYARNNQCYGSARSRYISIMYSFPNYNVYSGRVCSSLLSSTPLYTSCNAKSEYLNSYYSQFVSNSVNPVNSFLTFSSNISLAGLSSNVLPSNSQLAVVNATATSMRLAMSNVVYSGASAGQVVTASIAHMHIIKDENTHVQANPTYTLVAETKTTVTVTGSNSANSLYTQYTNALATAVSSNDYTTSLQSASKAYGATVTSTASATGVTSSTASITDVTPASSSSSSDDSLSSGAIAGIVIGSIVGFALIVGMFLYLMFAMKSSAPLATQSTNPVVAKELPSKV